MVNLGVNVAIFEAETILLTLREDFDVWCLPGGSIDEGESMAEAARREVREETGLDVELTRLVGIYSRLGWHDHHVALFAAKAIGGTLKPDPHEVLEARFFPLDALPEHLLVGTDEMLRDIAARRTGVVKTERITVAPDIPPQSRAEIYALRDQSGLGRSEFYVRHVPRLREEDITTELPGTLPFAGDD